MAPVWRTKPRHLGGMGLALCLLVLSGCAQPLAIDMASFDPAQDRRMRCGFAPKAKGRACASVPKVNPRPRPRRSSRKRSRRTISSSNCRREPQRQHDYRPGQA